MWRLNGLGLKKKFAYTLLVLILLVIFPEIISPFFEWRIILDWFTSNYSFLWRIFIWCFVLLLLYGFFIQGKLGLFFGELRRHRFLLVLLFGIVEGLFLYHYADNLKNFFNDTNSIKWLGSFLTMLVAAPIALLIWSFRNEDKIKDLQHTEESIRQTDFHKIEEWATTFPRVTTQKFKLATTDNLAITKETTNETEPKIVADMEDPVESKSDETKKGTLQIASIYQLLPYLKGEYGQRYVRPTMEIYLSLLSSWQWNKAEQTLAKNNKYDEITMPGYIEALHTIFNQENEFFRAFHKQDTCKKNNWEPLKNIDLKSIAIVIQNFEGINLEWANLKWSNFLVTSLKGANLKWADLEGATLEGVNLEEAIMNEMTILRNGSYWKRPDGYPDEISD
jgi:pentapeptide repeat protein